MQGCATRVHLGLTGIGISLYFCIEKKKLAVLPNNRYLREYNVRCLDAHACNSNNPYIADPENSKSHKIVSELSIKWLFGVFMLHIFKDTHLIHL
jgi:hypothetical protein